MSDLTNVTSLVGDALMTTFGHPFLGGAVMFALIAYTLHRANVPLDAAIVITVPLMIVLAGVIMPSWLVPFIILGLGALAGLGVLRLLGVV